MLKKLTISLVILCGLLIVLCALSFTGVLNALNSGTNDATKTDNLHELYGYYSPYQLGTTTCSAFVILSGEVNFVVNNGYFISDQEIISRIDKYSHPIMNIDPSNLSVPQKSILFQSHGYETAVYLYVKDAGINSIRLKRDLGCKSFVEIGSASSSPPTHSSSQDNDTSNSAATISIAADGQNLYSNGKYKLQFEYPQGWHVGDNQADYISLQLFNYDESKEAGESFRNNMSKIESTVADSDRYDPGPSPEYKELSRQTTGVKIDGVTAIRRLVEFEDGSKILTYNVPVPSAQGKLFVISMYGDPSNFPVLEGLISTLKWSK